MLNLRYATFSLYKSGCIYSVVASVLDPQQKGTQKGFDSQCLISQLLLPIQMNKTTISIGGV